MTLCNYPPGVTGNEPEIAGWPAEYDDYVYACDHKGIEPMGLNEWAEQIRSDDEAEAADDRLAEMKDEGGRRW